MPSVLTFRLTAEVDLGADPHPEGRAAPPFVRSIGARWAMAAAHAWLSL
jgi:hypothetical protein